MTNDTTIDVIIVGTGDTGHAAARAFAVAGMMAMVADIVGIPVVEKPAADAAVFPIRPIPHEVIIKMAAIDAKIITASQYGKQQRHYQKIHAARHAPRIRNKPR